MTRLNPSLAGKQSSESWELGELATQPEEKEAMEMVAGAEQEAKPLLHPLGKLVSSPGSVPVAAKEFVLRAGNTQIPPRMKSHGGGSTWGMCLQHSGHLLTANSKFPGVQGLGGHGFRWRFSPCPFPVSQIPPCGPWTVSWKGTVNLESYPERPGSHHRGAPGFLLRVPLLLQKIFPKA